MSSRPNQASAREDSGTDAPGLQSRGGVPDQPRVGIWWLVGDEVVDFGIDPETVAPCDGVRDSPDGHFRVWPRVVERFRQLRNVEYDEIPRGRVILQGDQFVVLLGEKESLVPGLVARIAHAFGLDSQNVRVVTDEHYATGVPGLTQSLLCDDELGFPLEETDTDTDVDEA